MSEMIKNNVHYTLNPSVTSMLQLASDSVPQNAPQPTNMAVTDYNFPKHTHTLIVILEFPGFLIKHIWTHTQFKQTQNTHSTQSIAQC